MPVTFFIPGPLRSFAAGRSEIAIETFPVTLADALEELWKQCPGIRDRVVNEQGQVREHVNIFVGKENVRFTTFCNLLRRRDTPWLRCGYAPL